LNTVNLFGAEVAPIIVFMFLGEMALIAAFATAWVLARRHKGKYHHFVMLSSFAIDLLVFKPLMITRALNVYGHYPWHGTNIAVHFWLDVVVAVLGVSTIIMAFRHRIKKNGKMFMPPKGKIHRLLGYAFLAFWAITFIVGVRLFVWAHLG